MAGIGLSRPYGIASASNRAWHMLWMDAPAQASGYTPSVRQGFSVPTGEYLTACAQCTTVGLTGITARQAEQWSHAG